ncbi:MAG: hypothetical protein H6634_15460 [Anaerolineales bacterium]|nr:hypothetical protein [Anaerolineales bacterium]
MMMYIKNRPSRSRRAILFDLSYPSTSKASPNDFGIVIIVIIIVIGEVVVIEHRGGIIAQSFCNVSTGFAERSGTPEICA